MRLMHVGHGEMRLERIAENHNRAMPTLLVVVIRLKRWFRRGGQDYECISDYDPMSLSPKDSIYEERGIATHLPVARYLSST